MSSEPGPAFLVRDRTLVALPSMPASERTHYEALDSDGRLFGRALIDAAWRGFVLEPFPRVR